MCVGATGVIDAAWLLRMGEKARQAATMSRAIKGMSQRSVRLNIGLPSFLFMFLFIFLQLPRSDPVGPHLPNLPLAPRPEDDCEDGRLLLARGAAIIESRDRCR